MTVDTDLRLLDSHAGLLREVLGEELGGLEPGVWE
jgi:hypothetical protein